MANVKKKINWWLILVVIEVIILFAICVLAPFMENVKWYMDTSVIAAFIMFPLIIWTEGCAEEKGKELKNEL